MSTPKKEYDGGLAFGSGSVPDIFPDKLVVGTILVKWYTHMFDAEQPFSQAIICPREIKKRKVEFVGRLKYRRGSS